MSISNLSLLVISFCSFLLTYFEVTSLVSVNQKNSLESYINETLPKLKFDSPEVREEKINTLVSKANSITTPPLDHQKDYLLGRLTLVSGLDSTKSEDKLNRICDSRDLIIKSSKSSPRNIDYQVAIADIESLSSSLIATCDSIKKLESPSISLNERLQWIDHLAPTYPPVLLKKGIIERSIGSRIEAMKSFRKFEENSLVPGRANRQFLMFQAQSDQELLELLPRKYPNLLTWSLEYAIDPNPRIDFETVFEKVFLEMIAKFSEAEANPKETLEKLYTTYWFRGIQYSESVKNSIAKLIFKIQSLNSNESFPKYFFGRLANQKKIPVLLSKNFSGTTKRSAQIYNWTSSNDAKSINIDIRSEGLGVYLPPNSKTESMTVQGDKGDRNISDLSASIWASDDNISFTQIKNLKSSKSGLIDNRPIATFDIPDINSKYLKVFFTLPGDKTQKLSAPANLILQFYSNK